MRPLLPAAIIKHPILSAAIALGLVLIVCCAIWGL
jgi:hypothetical protein